MAAKPAQSLTASLDRGEREGKGGFPNPGTETRMFFPFLVSFFSLCLRPLRASYSLIFLVFHSVLFGHPPPSPTDGPLKLSAPSRPSFHLSSDHRAVILMQPAFLSCIDSTLRSSRYGWHPFPIDSKLLHMKRTARSSLASFLSLSLSHSPLRLLLSLLSHSLPFVRKALQINKNRLPRATHTQRPRLFPTAAFSRAWRQL